MRQLLTLFAISATLVACSGPASLPRAEASAELIEGIQTFKDSAAVKMLAPTTFEKGDNLHSIMVVKDGAVVYEEYFGDWNAEKPHTMFSVSKTFTATAVGLAISEGKMTLKDKVADYFPDKQVEGNPCEATVEDLLMMAGGHDSDPTYKVLGRDNKNIQSVLGDGADIAAAFFAHPFVHEPGTTFRYNSLGSYILSAIVTKVTGESVLDYLTPRLFEPLGIDKPEWDADANGVSCGGWGLHLKTEDMAKMGLLMLQKGRWGRRQLVPAEWMETMGAKHIENCPPGLDPKYMNDWTMGYGYQTWRNVTEGFRADGAGGQFIFVLPSKNAVVVLTAWTANTANELFLFREHIYPYL